MKLESCVRNRVSDEILRHRHTCTDPRIIREIVQNHVRKDTFIISFMAAPLLSAPEFIF